MRHVDTHPRPVAGCFGCKVLGIGANMAYSASGGALVKERVDDHGGGNSVKVTEHWKDRQDVTVRPAVAHQKVSASKDPELRNRLRGIFT